VRIVFDVRHSANGPARGQHHDLVVDSPAAVY
jgi:hypothetical protein